MLGLLRELLFQDPHFPVDTPPNSLSKFKFDTYDPENISFDPKITGNRMSRPELSSLIECIKSTSWVFLQLINFLHFFHLLMATLTLMSFFAIMVGRFRLPQYTPILSGLLYISAVVVMRRLRRYLFWLCQKRTDRCFEDINYVKYHPRGLHWSFKYSDEMIYLELDLNYSSYVLKLPN